VESAADKAQGWELEYGLRYSTQAGNFDLLGTYADGKSQTAADPTIMAADFVPKKTSLMGKYSWTSGPLEGLMIGATYFDQTKKRNANFWIDFPATYNVFTRYAWGKHWSVQLNLNNITNERYIVAIAANGLVQTEPGFESMLQVKYKW
jgi:outer membrane receptor protein involved in Fe transport